MERRRGLVEQLTATVLWGLAAVAGWLIVRPGADVAPALPVVAAHVALADRVTGPGGTPLTRAVAEPALMVVPSRLPPFMRAQLAERVGRGLLRRPRFLWRGRSALFDSARGWNLPGLTPVRVLVNEPVPGLSPALLQAATAPGDWKAGPWRLDHGVWQLPGGRVTVAYRLDLARVLFPAVGPGGSVAVVDGAGRLLAAEANPVGRELFWQPRPVGLALIPPIMAQAMDHPELFRNLSVGQASLGTLASRWGNGSIRSALSELGVGAPSLAGQPVANPPLPTMSPAVLSAGRALWATPLEVARAYLIFLSGGETPPITLDASPRSVPLSDRPLVATADSTDQVYGALPTVVAGRVTFRVWRPAASDYAVCLVRGRPGVVMVVEGTATRNLLTLAGTLGRWLGNQQR